ncbi:MAG: hypothetical protein ABFD50_06275 [Smithella sp.]
MKSFQKAYEELALHRIEEIESEKRKQARWQELETKYQYLYDQVQSGMKEHGMNNLLKEFEAVQMAQTYEMYIAIYLWGLTDAFHLPAALGEKIEEGYQ